MTNTKPQIITIDGMSASGKGELSRRLAEHFDFDLLDSGAIYRALAYQLNELRICAPSKEEFLIEGIKKTIPLSKLMSSKKLTQSGEKLKRVCMIAEKLNLVFKLEKNPLCTKIYLNSKDITESIRTDEIGILASDWAIFHSIRDALYQKQRSYLLKPNNDGLIADGRDMGSVVFKEAKIKLFITANATVRTQRRAKELRIEGDENKIAHLFASIQKRDEQDSKREVSPLIKPKGAIEIDTSDLTIDETFRKALEIVQSKI